MSVITARAVSGIPSALMGVSRAASAYTITATTAEGRAVYSMCRMWVYSGAPAPIAQILVESDSGESLSPRYAPETTAPAVAAIGAPSAAAVPIRATPIVPAEPQEVPVNSDISAVARNAVSSR